jgi:hypothetical protein
MKKPNNHSISSHNLNFPNEFVKVLNKLIPDVNKVVIDTYWTHTKINDWYYEPTLEFLVEVIVHYKWNAREILPPDVLSETINTSFKLTYTDKDYIKFSVKKIEVEKRDYKQEFIDFFTN